MRLLIHAGRLYTHGREAVIVATQLPGPVPAGGPVAGGLVAWAERTGRRQVRQECRAGLRFAFYGRVSTEDYQDPVTSLARQLDQAGALVAGHGQIVARFFDVGQSRTLAWARRPQAAALVAQLADPDRGWDAVVIGEYERAFYGGQYASMAPLFEHYCIQLWTPEVGGRIDFAAEDHEQTMMALGLQSKREITRTRIRVRTAMAAQAREQGRYLGGRPPYGRRTGTGWLTPGRTRTRPMPRGAGGRTGWSLTRRQRRRWRGSSRSGWPGTAWPGSRAPSTTPRSRARPQPNLGATRTAAVMRGRCTRYARSWATPATPDGKCGTGSAPTATWSTRRTPGWDTGRFSGGTCPRAGSSPPALRTRRSSAKPTSSPSRTWTPAAGRAACRAAATSSPGY